MKSPGGVEEPTRTRKPRRNSAGSRGPFVQCSSIRAMNSSAAGMPRAIPNAGGSITVSERSSSGRRAAASSEITPPYEWPTRCVPGSRNCSSQTASSSKSTCSTSGPGREPAPVRRHDLEALGERFLGAPGQVRVDDGTVNEQEARLAFHAGFGCHKVPVRGPLRRCYSRRGCRGPHRRSSAPLEPVASS